MSTDRTRLWTGHFCIQRLLTTFCCKQSFYFICYLSPDTHLYHTHKHDLNLSKSSRKTTVSTDWTFFGRFTPCQPNENCRFICFLRSFMLYKLISWNIQEVFHVYLNKFANAVTHLFLVIFGNN